MRSRILSDLYTAVFPVCVRTHIYISRKFLDKYKTNPDSNYFQRVG